MAERPFGHEAPDPHVGRLMLVLGGLLGVVVAAVLVLHVLLHRDVLPGHARVVERAGVVPPAPRLQAHPDADIAAERAQAQQQLSGYAWTDPSHRFARIPIDRAMQLYADRHRPQRDAQDDAGGSP